MPPDDGSGHKHTVVCPHKKCKYTSRQWNPCSDTISVQNSVFSTKCPKHQKELVPLNSLSK